MAKLPDEQSTTIGDVKQLGLFAAIASLSYVFWIVGAMEMVNLRPKPLSTVERKRIRCTDTNTGSVSPRSMVRPGVDRPHRTQRQA